MLGAYRTDTSYVFRGGRGDGGPPGAGARRGPWAPREVCVLRASSRAGLPHERRAGGRELSCKWCDAATRANLTSGTFRMLHMENSRRGLGPGRGQQAPEPRSALLWAAPPRSVGLSCSRQGGGRRPPRHRAQTDHIQTNRERPCQSFSLGHRDLSRKHPQHIFPLFPPALGPG